jgi:hypothetical protein
VGGEAVGKIGDNLYPELALNAPRRQDLGYGDIFQPGRFHWLLNSGYIISREARVPALAAITLSRVRMA